VKGLFGGINQATGRYELSALAIVVYVIIVLVLLWPLVFALIRRILPARAREVVEEISHEAHPDADESHPLPAQSVSGEETPR
jgi:flagellar biosynthesis/type III secretory pathway M-ring protein FliF/YscJ